MRGKNSVQGLFVLFVLFAGIQATVLSNSSGSLNVHSENPPVEQIRRNLSEFLLALQTRDSIRVGELYSYFDSLIAKSLISDQKDLSEALYYCGLHLYFQQKYEGAYLKFTQTARLRESERILDSYYRKAVLNAGTSLFQLGRFDEAIETFDTLIPFIDSQDGPFSPDNISALNNLASSLNEVKQYERAITTAARGLEIAGRYNRAEDRGDIISLYNNLGISYSRQNDYSRALIYLDKAVGIIGNNIDVGVQLYINILNSLAITYTRLGNREMAESYYKIALPVAVNSYGESALLILSNYAVFLAEDGKKAEADKLLSEGIARLSVHYDNQNRFLYEMLERQAGILSRFDIDNSKAMSILEGTLIPFCRKNRGDHVLVRDAYHTYALVLKNAGRNSEALTAVQNSLFAGSADTMLNRFSNPDFETLIPDRSILGILSDKVFILRDIFRQEHDSIYLGHAIETNRILISYLETVRIDISEEESRIILGDNFRRLYDAIISDLHTMFTVSGKDQYFRQAFEYAERGKAAGLLVSMREVQARQFLIPDSLAVKEKNIESELGIIREMLIREMSKSQPDDERVSGLKNEEYNKVMQRTELTELFEKNYPEYYTAKYNTHVAGIDEILKKIRKRSTYINYIYTDTVLYIFVANYKHKSIASVPVDEELRTSIIRYRQLLSEPVSVGNRRQVFDEYSNLGHYLYKKLVLPVKDMLITKNLIISPDNFLTYIPFETLLTTNQVRNDILYRELDFLINDFNISYTYSATMYSATQAGAKSLINKVIAFAPVYHGRIDVDSVLNSRQVRQDTLFDLPYAREEATYAYEVLGGKLFVNDEARESVYKKYAAGFSVIHLAMHTIINDKSPAYSRLIFSSHYDNEDDGLLNTYEIYNIPLSASMVVVSSCNTGSGQLRTGEGVMSLARGFINAGSKSVVMSLWEVHDLSGTEVVKLFYRNISRGMTKSTALRSAKLEFLENSAQYQSHPFYWSTLVLYGNTESLFPDRNLIIGTILLLLAIVAFVIKAVFYFRSR